MRKIIFMKGIACSGKSTYVKNNFENKGYAIISTDKIREELNITFNKSEKDISKKVAYERALSLIPNANVVLDCCNVGRHGYLNDIISRTKANAELHWIVTHPDVWLNRASERVERKQVFNSIEEVLRTRQEMYDALFYTSKEDFDNVKYIITDREVEKVDEFITFYKSNKDLFINDIREFVKRGIELNIIQYAFPELMDIINYNQGNIHHSLTLDEHTFKVCENLPKTEEWIWIGLLHDLGKVVKGIRVFNPETKNNTYRGHAGASTDIAICALNRFGFNQYFIDNVVRIVNRHMYLPYNDTLSQKKIKALGVELYEKLLLFREADMNGK